MCKPNYGGIVLLPLLLASCIGGNFGVQPVVESTPTAYPVTFKSKDVPTPPPAKPSIEITPVNRPAVGAAMRLPRRNIAFYNKDGTEIPDKHQAEQYLPLKEKDILFLDGTPQEQADKLKKEINGRYPNAQIYTSDSKKDDAYQYKYVRAGYVYTQKGEDEIEQNSGGKQFTHRLGYDGFVYYSGEHPSQSLPSAGMVKYSGNWQYMTDVKRHRTGKAVASEDLGYTTYYGNDIGATSYAARDADDREKHPAEYTVDFDKKTLTGQLIKNQYVRNKNNPDEPKKPLTIYNITAKLDGNRFTGSAKVNTKLKTSHADKEHLFFHTDADQRLEGGFFGDNGEELAGRFISNDNSVFGVFAGKQKTDASGTNPAMPSEKHTKILDSLKISVDEATDKNARPFAISPMPDFGHPDKLLVEGREIPLVNQEQIINLADGRKMTVRACCDFLTYVKLGRIKTDRPASKPKAEDKREDEEDTGVGNGEEGTEDEAAEGSEGGEDEIGDEEEGTEDATVGDEGGEEDEAEEPEEESPEEGGGGGSDGISPAPEAPKGRDIDLFLKGIRTAEADIPKTGTAHYTGTWEARISKPIQWDNQADKTAKAEFNVDFGKKSISGTLTEKNGVEPAFHIEKGVIDGNGFHATARTRDNGINLSGNDSTNPQSFKANNLLVTGGFYGPQAEELGGTIFNKDGKSLDITEDTEHEAETETEAGVGEQLEPEVKPQFGVVFGAKKDNKEVEK
ncbi:transferrin-binding protein-like solute binding protein [Neisseria meningitidis]|uniref:transferrin-binding protein-like solute binding protein n=1 Tax=Neisseria meningitidis TaxID=487 RepID=UPI0018CA9E5B|nr:transferrin-binding protein-like solute binding protein [Neisseria meningitidis]MBG8856161.1 transferrin-binding protein-like solute binding protein [Neisseria meningitidis]MBG8864460.1 transferrin-binding protein-like solute binding protein [Neisseria meningitidis]MBG8866586.1 transferrin-binding protein-like solute binding protein [Neisseria meningitidis]MBG8868563.1 transferrin-binding protein-like solute binding protein [Neisseria meningitidis]MBG8871916.1 transferrin-binding protein-li